MLEDMKHARCSLAIPRSRENTVLKLSCKIYQYLENSHRVNFHRIIEWFGSEWNSKGHIVPHL